MIEQKLTYTETEKSIALEKRTRAFLAECKTKYENALGMHYLRIESDQRNLALSRFAYYLQDKDALPELKRDIEEFLKGFVFVAAAAVMFNSELAYLIAPSRHADVLRKLRSMGKQESAADACHQGFAVWHEGSLSYCDRKSALELASSNGQLRRLTGGKYYQGPELFSEDLW